MSLLTMIDPAQPSLWIAVASIVFNPLFWNIVARQEYRNKLLTKLVGGPYRACYTLAAAIFLLGLLRDHLYKAAIEQQPTLSLLDRSDVRGIAIAAFCTGTLLVVSSMYALGVTGTYLGDYSGILMEERVVGFPFNVTDNPMYYGSTLSFFGTALWYQSPAGLLLTVLVYVEYKIALLYEEPFTAAIYAARDASRAKAKLTAPTAADRTPKAKARSTAVADFVPRETRQRTATGAEKVEL